LSCAVEAARVDCALEAAGSRPHERKRHEPRRTSRRRTTDAARADAARPTRTADAAQPTPREPKQHYRSRTTKPHEPRAAQAEAARGRSVQEAAAKREAVLRAIDDSGRRGRQARCSCAPVTLRVPTSLQALRFARTPTRAHHTRKPGAVRFQLNRRSTWSAKRQADPHRSPRHSGRSQRRLRGVGDLRQIHGVPAIDEALRRIVQSQSPTRCSRRPGPRVSDVIEIRRTWHFDMAIRCTDVAGAQQGAPLSLTGSELTGNISRLYDCGDERSKTWLVKN
jgi:hypothetical protein